MESIFRDSFLEYFQLKGSNFYIIYDKFRILGDFFENLNKLDYEIQTIDSSQNPSELIHRKSIVNSFDEKSGWYSKKWILYIYGEHIQNVIDFQCFSYYTNLTSTFIFKSFLDLLMDSKLNFAQSLPFNYDFFDNEVLNKSFTSLIEVFPINCFVSNKKVISHSAFWMVFLHALKSIDDPNDFSPVFLSYLSLSKTFDIESVLLELIYLIAPNDFQIPFEEPFNNFFSLFSFINNEFNNYFTFTEGISDNINELVQSLFLLSNPSKSKPKKAKNKGLISYTSISKQLSEKQIQILKSVFHTWLSNSNQIFIQRVQHYSELIRSKSSPKDINDKELSDYSTSFSFSADVDLHLINYILNNLSKQSYESINDWSTFINNLIQNRNNLWSQFSPGWWSEKPIFSSDNSTLTLNQLWNLTKHIGILFVSFKLNYSDWDTTKKIIWEIQKAHDFLVFHINNDIFNKLSSLSFMKLFISKAWEGFLSIQQKLNSLFVSDYESKNFYQKNQSYIISAQNLIQDAINELKQDHKVGLIFIDAFRSDIAQMLSDQLSLNISRSKSFRKSPSISNIDTYTILPSITSIGWPLILAHEDKIQLKLQNNSVTVQLMKGDKILTFSSPSDRNKRIESILSTENIEYSVFNLQNSDLLNSISEFKSKSFESSSPLIPVLWHDKFDNHDLSEREFFSSLSKELDELVVGIKQLHLDGIQKIFIFTDHGFLFAKNSDIVKDLPAGESEVRFSISSNTVESFNSGKYPDWLIWSFKDKSLPISATNDFTVITPKDFAIFKKLGKDERLVHGGLSYLECNITFLVSNAILLPKVEIESISYSDHKIITDHTGRQLIELKNAVEGFKRLEFTIHGSLAPKDGEKPKDLRFKLQIDYANRKIEPDDFKVLKPGGKIAFQVHLHNPPPERELSLKFLNESNEIVKIEKIYIKSSLYDIGL